MKEHSTFLAKKNLGQHFLKDKKVISEIIQSIETNLVDLLIEVGPGPGALTLDLVTLSLPLLLIERDNRFVNLWKEYKIQNSNSNCHLDIISDDALEVNYQSLIGHRKTWLVSNLPYNISTPLTRLFLELPLITHMTLMYQKEVADRLLGKGGMNSFHFLLSSHFKITMLQQVKPGAFNPPPKVDSTVIKFQRLVNPLFSLTELKPIEAFTRKLFSSPRKQIKTHFPELFKLDAFIHLATIRAEKLQASDILQLYQVWAKSGYVP
jgi:16S rRNA (adenine1518-N6/adenine1519-N6)-dimethyltransferase